MEEMLGSIQEAKGWPPPTPTSDLRVLLPCSNWVRSPDRSCVFSDMSANRSRKGVPRGGVGGGTGLRPQQVHMTVGTDHGPPWPSDASLEGPGSLGFGRTDGGTWAGRLRWTLLSPDLLLLPQSVAWTLHRIMGDCMGPREGSPEAGAPCGPRRGEVRGTQPGSKPSACRGVSRHLELP